MNAVLSPSVKTLPYIVEVALGFNDARKDLDASKHGANHNLSNAYLCIEGAISALQAEGTQLALIAKLLPMAHELAPTYEHQRNHGIVLHERYVAKLKEMHELRVTGDQLREEAERIGTDTVESEDIAIKLDEVADFLDDELTADYS